MTVKVNQLLKKYYLIKRKIQVLENILNCQAKTKEYHSLYLDTTYVIHRMLYKLKDISDKECCDKSPIWCWNEYDVLSKIQDEKYTEDIVRNKLLIMEYFKVLKRPIPKLIIDFKADVFVPTVIPTLKWTTYSIISEDWSKYFKSKIHRDLTMIFALLYFNGANVTAKRQIVLLNIWVLIITSSILKTLHLQFRIC